MRKIAFVGTHGTGKTTLAHRLVATCKEQGINTEFLGEVVRDSPYPINEKQTLDGFEWTIYTQYLRERWLQHRCNLLVCDRSVFDSYVYAVHRLGRIRLLEDFTLRKIKGYEALIKVPMIGRRLTHDGVRSIDPGFQRSIDEQFDYLAREMQIPLITFKSIEQVIDLIRQKSHKTL